MLDARAIGKRHAGPFAWPTLALLGLIGALEILAWSGALPLFASGLVATLAAYLAFTVMHEASHGNVHGGNRRLSWIGDLAGWAASAALFAPYPAFRVLHLRHHAHTNDAAKDPDFFVAGPAWAAPLRCLVTLPQYYREFLFGPTSRSAQGRRERTKVWLALGLYLAVALGLTIAGRGADALALWIGPALAASAVLAFFFDWLPHHPHRSRERFHDTRAVDVRALDLPLLGQNLHLVHHLWPRVPFYRYRAAFEDARALLADEGAPIVTLRSAARR